MNKDTDFLFVVQTLLLVEVARRPGSWANSAVDDVMAKALDAAPQVPQDTTNEELVQMARRILP